MSSSTVPRSLKFLWSAAAKNVATNNNTIAAGGGVLFGLIVNNLAVTAFNIGIFNPPAVGTAPILADQVLVFPIAASGSLIILPEEFGICECNRNLCWAGYAAGDTSVIGAVAGASLLSAQFAYI